jgi:hypothetical protein
MMSHARAQALAEALRKKHPKKRKRIDADAVRMFCVSNAEAERGAADPDWLERGPLDEVAAWVNIEQVVR